MCKYCKGAEYLGVLPYGDTQLIPKYIEKLINRRAGLAVLLNHADAKLAEWLEKKGVDVEEYDIYGGCEIYANPWGSADRIKQAIRDK
ncbi:MAG: hypothetical protein K2P21_08945 [Lachnospiraceae bacterium]|jgi:hypothetical protein|nr:hypothetical protein [Lachnospiraceae bacterium]